jgi:alkylation response protein AidB-like acyl-CoA dehydrogenase
MTPPATAAAPDLDDSPVVRGAARFAAELAADAARLEQEGVDRPLVDRMAEAGLLAVSGPPALRGAWPAEQRRVAELLAGASPDAWFVWFQHGPVVRMLKASDNLDLVERRLPGLCAGRELGGVAWSSLRTATPTVHATRTEGGWSLSGFQPWCTGWGLIDVVLVGGLVQSTEEVVFGLVPATPSPALASAGELRLAAMSGTSTHALRLTDLRLPDEDVVLRRERGPWAEGDRALNCNVQPSTFGIGLAALDLLEARAPEVAAVLRARVLDVRSRAYRLLDEVDGEEALDERLALRAQALLLGVECCTALLTARGGQGMDLAEPAQRLLRAAAFQVVHSSAAHVRTATLSELVRR